MARVFSVLAFPDGDGYSVTVPSLPGCFSQGVTLEEAVEHAKEAISLHVEGMEADGEPIPDEAEHRPFLALVAV